MTMMQRPWSSNWLEAMVEQSERPVEAQGEACEGGTTRNGHPRALGMVIWAVAGRAASVPWQPFQATLDAHVTNAEEL